MNKVYLTRNEYDMSTIHFKSIPEVFYKEMGGLKPNTIRVFDHTEEQCFSRTVSRNGKPDKIRIVNTNTGEEFTRKITDVTKIMINGVNIFCFSWNHVGIE
jgi:hypothetical protein